MSKNVVTAIAAMIFVVANGPPAAAQSSCTVYSAQELQQLLDCLANCSSSCNQTCPSCPCSACSGICTHKHIIIDSSATIDVPNQYNGNWISIGCEHSGLHLTINGTINWVGGVDTQQNGYKVLQINGASNVTIDGTGSFTSPEDPSSNEFIAIAIRILDGQNIAIADLSFENLNSMVEQQGGSVDHVTLSNLQGMRLSRYGVFISDASNLHVEDCRVGDPNNPNVVGTYNQHGFRIYARTYPDIGQVTIENCSAHHVNKSGLWLVEGDDLSVDGFISDSYLRVGPNFSCKDAGLDTGDGNGNPKQRVRRAEIKNVDVEYVQVELGTMGADFENVTVSGSIYIGRDPGLLSDNSDTVVQAAEHHSLARCQYCPNCCQQ